MRAYPLEPPLQQQEVAALVLGYLQQGGGGGWGGGGECNEEEDAQLAIRYRRVATEPLPPLLRSLTPALTPSAASPPCLSLPPLAPPSSSLQPPRTTKKSTEENAPHSPCPPNHLRLHPHSLPRPLPPCRPFLSPVSPAPHRDKVVKELAGQLVVITTTKTCDHICAGGGWGWGVSALKGSSKGGQLVVLTASRPPKRACNCLTFPSIRVWGSGIKHRHSLPPLPLPLPLPLSPQLRSTAQFSMWHSECKRACREARLPPLPRFGACPGATTLTCRGSRRVGEERCGGGVKAR